MQEKKNIIENRKKYNISFKLESDKIFNQNLILYRKIKSYDTEILFKNSIYNYEFFTMLYDTKSVITFLIQGERGTYKSKLARNLAMLMEKNIENFEFNIKNVVFNDNDLYDSIRNYINKYENEIYKDLNFSQTLFIRDENPAQIGLGSNINLLKLQKLAEQIRIAKINIILITPAQNIDYFNPELEFNFILTPFAYDKIEKKFFCLIKEHNDLNFIGNVIIPDIDFKNNKYYKEYDKNKRIYLKKTSQEITSEKNYYQNILKLHEKFNILDKNYKIVNKNEIKLKLIKKSEFYLRVQQIGLMMSIKDYDILYSQYELIMFNEQEFNNFLKFCKANKYKLKQNDNFNEINENLINSKK